MTSPTLVFRNLTVNFARSVSASTQTPITLQVVLTALSTPTSVVAGATFIEAPLSRDVLLANTTNSVVFRLVPSDLAGLSQRVLYRIAWRSGGATGRTFTYDFAMPNADVTFEQIKSLNYVIDGQVYLQQTDLGVAGRIARLNSSGQVVNAAGNPVASPSDLTALQTAIAAEVTARQSGDTQTRTQLQTSLDTQITGATTAINATVSGIQQQLATQISTEVAARAGADAAHNAALNLKADLVSGIVPLSQLPEVVRTNPVTSVNGSTGAVSLSLTSVAAVGGAIPQSQVTNLTSDLAGKASTASLTTATGRITAIENDTTVVKTVAGVIPSALNDSRMAYVDASGQFITRKDGTIISGAGGAVASVNSKAGNVVLTLTDVASAGGAISQAQVSGLTTALSGKVDNTDARLTNSRTPSTHAASHASGGSDALTLATTQVTGLATTLSTYGTRLTSLETRVTAVEGSGGGGGTIGTLTWFAGSAPTGTFSTLALRSPFGYNPTNASANAQGFYYNPAGAESADVRFPYITPNGHLELRRWDESAPADPVLATAADLTALTTIVNGKAAQSDLSTLTTTVSGKASQSALDSLTSTVNTRAAQSALDSLITTVGTKANTADVTTLLAAKASQTDLTSLTTTVGTKAAQSALDTLTTTVGTKASQTDLTALTTTVGTKASQSAVDAKEATANKNQPNGYAGLGSDGKLSTSQLPSLALSSVQTVASRAAMLALTSTTVQPGDVCIITTGVDQGSYILTATDPSVFTNWTLLTTPTGTVSSVNGQTGTVVLTASSVSALPSNGTAAISSISGLTTALSGKIDSAGLTSALANRPSWSATSGSPTLETILSASSQAKQKATYVATSAVASLTGQQSADGVVMPIGSVVLLTAQSSSVANGLWVVNTSAWTRVTDMASGSYLVKGTLVVVSSGNTNANTLWQVTSASGVVDTAANNWAKIGSVGSGYTATAGNGITITGASPTQAYAVRPSPTVNVGTGTVADPTVAQSQGISVSSTGVAVDTSIVARKYVGDVPSGSLTPRIYHNLNTRRVLVQVIEVSTGIGVLVGWQASAANYVDLEFSSVPTFGQWAVLVIG